MTKPSDDPDQPFALLCCELCNAHSFLQAYRVFLGAGLGWGKMWLCSPCLAEKLKAKAKQG